MLPLAPNTLSPGCCLLILSRYEADHAFSLPTVYFFLATIFVFSAARFLPYLLAPSVLRSTQYRRIVSATRYLSYKSWRFGTRNTQSLGAYLLAGVGFIFFAAMTLGPQPYYWPTDAHYGNSPPIATRTGWMALACLPFILILGSKASLVSTLTGVSHEKLNVWHGWISWAMLVLALIHTFPFIIFHQSQHDLVKTWHDGGLWLTGVIALIAQAWLTFMSISWVRNRYYEFFKATHIFFAITFFVFFMIHCGFVLTSWDYFIAAAVLYGASLLFAYFKTYFHHGISHTARLRLETPHSLRVAVDTKSDWTPGQHVFLRFITGGTHALTAHPFTICSVPKIHAPDSLDTGGEMIFFLQPRGGLTRRLAAAASKQPDVGVKVLMEGPYGGLPERWSEGFDRTLLIAGGSGCGFTLALVEDWVRKRRLGISSCCDQLHVVLATRDPEMRIWYMEELQRIMKVPFMAGVSELAGLSIHFHETHTDVHAANASSSEDEEKNVGKERTTTSPRDDDASSTASLFGVTFFQGRPVVGDAVSRYATQPGVTVGVSVCGPSGMVHDASAAAANAQRLITTAHEDAASELLLHTEAFSY